MAEIALPKTAEAPNLQYQVVFVTVPNMEIATALAKGLLKAKLAACVSMIAGVESRYRWEGRVEKASEIILMIKTRASLSSDIAQFVKAKHPYTVPEVICVPITDGSEAYLNWIGANTTFVETMAKKETGKKP